MKDQYKILNLPNPSNSTDAVNKQYLDNIVPQFDNKSIVRNDTNMNFNSTTFTGLESIYVNRNPINNTELSTKQYVDGLINDPSIVINTDNVKFNNFNLDNVRFVRVNSYPAKNSHVTCKEYVDNHIIWAVDEPTLFRNNKDNDFNGYKLTNISSVSVTHDAVEDNDLVTLGYVKSLHQENERNRRDLGLNFYDENDNLVKNNQTNDFNDNIILNVQSIELNDNPTSNKHAAIKNM